jgi:hypothetical protein
MIGKGRYGRPNRTALLTMIAINGALALIALTISLAIFGVRDILPPRPEMFRALRTMPWEMIWPMLPGAAVAYGCLWYWLIVVGRSRGVPWGGAVVYGMVIALVNVPVGGFIYGGLNNYPLAALIYLVLLLIVPVWLLAVCFFGIAMGLCNGYVAQWWIERSRR